MSIIEELQLIRKLAIFSLFSDDYFMDVFVLKGGNALDLAYKISSRASIDIDVSMQSDFKNEELDIVSRKLEKLLVQTFSENKYHVFDFKFLQKPRNQSPETADFWGGYSIEFKIIPLETYKSLKSNDIDTIRRHSLVVGEGQKRTFKIDISKFEYCESKKEQDLDDLTIYVYTPLMIVYEKLRAICQQMDEYIQIVPTNQRPRAKDFFDIYVIMENLITLDDFCKPSNLKILKEIFKIKKVPISLLGKIEDQKDFHRDSFSIIKDSVYKNFKLKSYDYYFDYVVEKVKLLESLWKK